MSSQSYSAELIPDVLLRRVLLVAGLVATCIGCIMLLLLPVGWPWRSLAAIAWLGINVLDLIVIRAGHRRCDRFRLQHDGEVEIRSCDGCWFPATLLRGSVVLPGIAWLRFESGNGQRFAELLWRKRTQSEAWRRLQVIWRHLGAGG